MILIANKNKKRNKYLPMVSLVDEKDLKKNAKKQIMDEIINNPESLRAYKEIETYKIAEIDENMKILKVENQLMFSYEDLLNDIVKFIVKGEEKNGKSE